MDGWQKAGYLANAQLVTDRFAKRWGPSRVRDVSSFQHVSQDPSADSFLGIPVLSGKRSRPSRYGVELRFRYDVRS